MGELVNNLFWWVGLALMIAVTLHAAISFISATTRHRHEQRRRLQREKLFACELDLARQRLEVIAESGLAWGGWRKFRVARKEFENEEQTICSFYFEPHDGKPVPTFEPGQYLTFQAKPPDQEKPLVRCYSLSVAPHAPMYRVSIRRVPPPRGTDFPPGRMSSYFHEHVNEGDILDLKAPSGSFYLDTTSQQPVVLLAGGVGITPMLSMLDAIIHAGTGREVWLFYGVTHGSDLAMKHHLRKVDAEYPNVHIQLCFSNPREGIDEIGRDCHHCERVSVELMKRLLPSNNYDFYMCGPPPMMDALTADLAEWGVPDERVHKEAFGPTHKKKPIKVESKAGETAVEVKFVRSGKTCSWTPEAGTLLELARANDVNVDSGCEQGDCGTCMVSVRSGAVEYQKTPGFKAEGGTCLTCVSTPKEPLELDA